MIAKAIFKLGQKLRNPSLNKWYLFLKSSENWTLEELEAYRIEFIGSKGKVKNIFGLMKEVANEEKKTAVEI